MSVLLWKHIGPFVEASVHRIIVGWVILLHTTINKKKIKWKIIRKSEVCKHRSHETSVLHVMRKNNVIIWFKRHNFMLMVKILPWISITFCFWLSRQDLLGSAKNCFFFSSCFCFVLLGGNPPYQSIVSALFIQTYWFLSHFDCATRERLFTLDFSLRKLGMWILYVNR